MLSQKKTRNFFFVIETERNHFFFLQKIWQQQFLYVQVEMAALSVRITIARLKNGWATTLVVRSEMLTKI